MWPGTDPLTVSTQPQLGERLLWTIPDPLPRADPQGLARVDLPVGLRAEIADLSARLARVEAHLARPWWGVRWWTALTAALHRAWSRLRHEEE
jgi:hypothetical protein